MKKFAEMFYYTPSFQAAQIMEESFPLPAGCTSLHGKKLLFVSDIHLSHIFPIDALHRLLHQIASLRPDMILLGGDYAESPSWQRQFFEEISKLAPPLGIYAVAGNNDTECFPENIEQLTQIAAQFGITLLVNRTERVRVAEDTIAIAGLDDFEHGQHAAQPLFEACDESALRILLSHYPQGASHYLSHLGGLHPHMALSGHTHGGQFSVCGITPFSIGFERRIHGLKLPAIIGWTNIQSTRLLVSPGIGTSRLPFRLCVPPAFHLIQL